MATVKVYRYDADTGKAISTFVRVGKFGTDKADKEETAKVSEFPMPYLTKPNGNLYAIEIYSGINQSGDYFEILGIFDSKEKAEKVKIEYENSEEYQIDTNDNMWDYYDVHIAEYEINTLTRNFD